MPAPNFDPVARPYRFLEFASFGTALWNCRIAHLAQVTYARRVLMAGEGDGRFLAAFLKAAPNAQVDYLDASPAMTRLAAQRASARVRFLTGDALEFPLPAAEYDLIVTHFFLDCFQPTEIERLIPRFAAAALPSARWLVSEFRATNPITSAIVTGLYLFFGATTGLTPRRLPAYEPALKRAGFRCIRKQTRLFGLLTAELYERD